MLNIVCAKVCVLVTKLALVTSSLEVNNKAI